MTKSTRLPGSGLTLKVTTRSCAARMRHVHLVDHVEHRAHTLSRVERLAAIDRATPGHAADDVPCSSLFTDASALALRPCLATVDLACSMPRSWSFSWLIVVR